MKITTKNYGVYIVIVFLIIVIPLFAYNIYNQHHTPALFKEFLVETCGNQTCMINETYLDHNISINCSCINNSYYFEINKCTSSINSH